MKRRSLNAAALLGLSLNALPLTGCGGGSDGAAKANYGKVNALLDGLVASGIVPGANVLIRQWGEEMHYHQAGLSDVASGTALARDTIFRLFSMTKPVVAAAVMALVDEGVLRLDDPIGGYVPELAQLGVYAGEQSGVVQTTPARPILIRHLLTHTAGFSYWFFPDEAVSALYAADPGIGLHEDWRFDPALGGLAGLARTLARLPLVSQPGERWHYSMALEVAGMVIERATGETLDKVLKRKIFDPLSMNDTGFAVPADQARRLASLYAPKAEGGFALLEKGSESPLLKKVPGLSGGGGLVSTIDDYSRFAEMLRAGGELGGRRVLSQASARAMATNQLSAAQLVELPGLAAWGLGGSGDGLGFGLGGAVVLDPPRNGVPAFRGEYSWGGAASTAFWVDPVNRMTVVFMTQLQPPIEGLPRDKLHSAIYG